MATSASFSPAQTIVHLSFGVRRHLSYGHTSPVMAPTLDFTFGLPSDGFGL